ncbi:MAG: response regulator [Gemmatimonadaceae bacterium]|nr:response regulator [Gemmatimonadaceae bacterium]
MLTFRTRVVLAVAAATVPALGAILYTGLDARRMHVAVGQARMLRDVRQLVDIQNALFSETRLQLSLLARLPVVSTGSSDACNALLADVKRDNPRLGTLTRITTGLRMDCSTTPFTPDLADVSHVASIQTAAREQRDVVGFYRLARDGATPLVTVIHPVKDAAGRLTFYLASDLALPWFARRARLASDSGFSVSLVRADGHAIILHSGRRVVRDSAVDRPLADFSTTDSTSRAFLMRGGDGMLRVGAYSQLPATDGPKVIATIAAPAGPLLATAAASLRGQLALLAVCALLGGILAWLVSSHWLGDDVRVVADAADRITRNELSLELTHRPRTRELAAVVSAFEGALNRIEREQRSYLELANASGDCVGRVDEQLRVTDANDALLRLTHHDRVSIAGRLISEVYGDDGMAREIAALAASCISGNRAIEREVAAPPIEGRDQWTEVRCVPSHSDTGAVDGALVITRDATARRALQREVEQSQRVESLGRFAGGIAHDFNNMLTVVMNCAQLGAAELPTDHPSREDLLEIEDVARRSADLTRQLLAFARRQPSAAQALEPAALLRECEVLVRRLLGPDITLVTEVAPGTPHIWFERSQFDQVLVNLSANARDAMPERGRLTITVREADVPRGGDSPHLRNVEPGRYVRMDVTDSGAGMEPHVISRIFEPFFTTKSESQGTGLGLAVVYGAVTQHGGAVWVDSAPGRGSTFHVLFRQPPSALEPIRPTLGAAEPTGAPSLRVLVVDDEPAVRNVAARLLESRGFVTFTATGGPDGLSQVLAAEPPFDAVVTDLTMPQMNGAELATALLARQPSLGVVITSGFPEALSQIDAALAERCVLLPKPFNEASLSAAVLAATQVQSSRRGATAG